MPFSSVSSTINAKPAIFPPIFSINFPDDSAVPPVANKSYLGTLVTFRGFGAGGTVVIEITSSEREVIDELTFASKSSGGFSTIWSVPKDTPPGTYTIKATSLDNSAEITLVLE